LSGHVEAHETFICGKACNLHIGQHKRRITETARAPKTTALSWGILERVGEVRAVTGSQFGREKRCQAGFRKHVEVASALHSDCSVILSWFEKRLRESSHRPRVSRSKSAFIQANPLPLDQVVSETLF